MEAEFRHMPQEYDGAFVESAMNKRDRTRHNSGQGGHYGTQGREHLQT